MSSYEPDIKIRKVTSIESDRSHNESAGSSTKETSACDSHQESSIRMYTSVQDFARIRHLPAYVDKSMLIKSIIDGEPGILLVAPRRFGKSVNLDMIKRFFEILEDRETMTANRKLFEGLKIEEHTLIMDKCCGKYPVIFLDFKSKGTIATYYDAFSAIRTIVHKAYKKHSYLQYSDKITDCDDREYIQHWCSRTKIETKATENEHIFNALENLAEYLCIHFSVNEIVLLVDEYDNICTNAVFNVKDYFDKRKKKYIEADEELKIIIEFCVGSLGCLAKGNVNVGRIILAGISYLMTQGLSGLTNIEPYKFQETHPYQPYYGLSAEEVEKLLRKFSLDSKSDLIERYYNGYRNNMFSILSIMKYLNKVTYSEELETENFWKESGLDQTLHLPSVKSIVLKLMTDLSNEIEIDYSGKLSYTDVCKLKSILHKENLFIEKPDIFFNFLLEQGYFKVVSLNKNNGKVVIRIPNEEIKSEFREKLFTFYVNEYSLDFSALRECASVFDEINSSDENKKTVEKICELLNNIIMPIVIPAKNETTFHHIIFIVLLLCSKFKCFSDVQCSEESRRRLDLYLLSCEFNLGIVIELKYQKTADEALQQIIDKKYYEAFQNIRYNPDKKDINYKVFVGLNVSCEQEVTMSALLNSFNLEDKILFVKNN